MENSSNRVVREATDLPLGDELALVEMLLASADPQADPDAETVWDAEILERMRAVDEGREKGVPYEEVLRTTRKIER